jgi:HD-like signal output (HDOD) protein
MSSAAFSGARAGLVPSAEHGRGLSQRDNPHLQASEMRSSQARHPGPNVQRSTLARRLFRGGVAESVLQEWTPTFTVIMAWFKNGRPEMVVEADEARGRKQQACRNSLAERIRHGTFDLPLLPQVVNDVLALTQDGEADVAALSDLVHRDPSLAGHVLRVANSAAYAGSQAIVSLQQAITRLGMKLLSEITIAVSLGGNLFRAPAFEGEIKQIWRHALASGAYGKEAARLKRSNVEGQFLCGLLHTMGKPVVLQILSELMGRPGLEVTRDEALNLMDEFHGPVGARLAEEWKLPRQVQVTCAHYLDYARAPLFGEETALTWLSDRLGAWLVAPDDYPEERLKEEPVFERLNYYPDKIEELLGKREAVLEVVNAMDL